MRLYSLSLGLAVLVLAACGPAHDDTPDAMPDADMPPDVPPPPPPPPPDEVVSVAMGHGVACAVMKSGTVRCWGANDFGQLGVAPSAIPNTCSAFGRTAKCRETPTEVPGLSDVTSVSVGFYHACAVKGDGTIACWGRNARGQLGHDPAGDETCSGQACSPTPRVVAGLANVAEVVVAVDHSCARTKAGAVMCWGENSSGTLGNGVTGGPSFTPVAVTGFASGASRISTAGFTHTTCAIKDGEVFCWGINFGEGNLGIPPTADPCACQRTPAKVAGVAGVIDIAVGERTVCAVVAGGAVTCWGANLHGQTGISPTEPNRFQPKVVPGLAQVVSLSGSMATTCARMQSGAVMCWGASSGGAIGNNSFAGDACQLAPCRATPVSAALQNVEDLAMGTSGIARDAAGVVRAWGPNGFGELGHLPGTGNDATCGSGNCNATPSVVTFAP